MPALRSWGGGAVQRLPRGAPARGLATLQSRDLRELVRSRAGGHTHAAHGRARYVRAGAGGGELNDSGAELGEAPAPRSIPLYSGLVPYTHGYRDATDLRRHFIKHGAEFGCASSWAYETLADTFLGGSLGPYVAEYVRPGGDRVRYNQTTHELGILSREGYIRTYFVPPGNSVRKRLYFCEQCK